MALPSFLCCTHRGVCVGFEGGGRWKGKDFGESNLMYRLTWKFCLHQGFFFLSFHGPFLLSSESDGFFVKIFQSSVPMNCDCDSWDNIHEGSLPIQSCAQIFLQGDNFPCWCFLAQPGPARSRAVPQPLSCATLHPSVPEGAQGHARRAHHFINAMNTAPAVGFQLARAPSTRSRNQTCTTVGQLTQPFWLQQSIQCWHWNFPGDCTCW